MKIKGVVAFALILALFLAGNILLFGKVGSGFFVLYFILALFLLVLLGVALKKVLTKGDKIIFAIAIIGMAIFIALFAQSVKDYMNKNQQMLNEEIGTEVNNLTQMNQFYSDYANYLAQQIITIRTSSETLQKQIDALKTQTNQPETNPPGTNNSIIYIPSNTDDGKEKEND
jgi:hypothetical protein